MIGDKTTYHDGCLRPDLEVCCDTQRDTIWSVHDKQNKADRLVLVVDGTELDSEFVNPNDAIAEEDGEAFYFTAEVAAAMRLISRHNSPNN